MCWWKVNIFEVFTNTAMRVLYNIEILLNPSEEEKIALQKIIQVRTLQKNDYFLKEGDVCKTIAFIEKGSVRYYYQLEDKEICKDFVFENGIIGAFGSFFSQDPSGYFIKAMEETQIVELNYEDVMHLYEKFPSWQKFGRIIAQEQFIRYEKREAAFLKDQPELRFRSLVEEHPKIFKRVPLQFIASYLGITRETLSRYRNKG